VVNLVISCIFLLRNSVEVSKKIFYYRVWPQATDSHRDVLGRILQVLVVQATAWQLHSLDKASSNMAPDDVGGAVTLKL